jgi:hypothetical protein
MKYKSNVVFFPTNLTALYGMLSLAKKSANFGIKSFFMCPNTQLIPNGFEYIVLDKTSTCLSGNYAISNFRNNFYSNYIKSTKLCLLGSSKRMNQYLDKFEKISNRMQRYLNSLKPSVVYIYGDRSGIYEIAICEVCKNLNITTVILPISYESGVDNLFANLVSKGYINIVPNFCKKILDYYNISYEYDNNSKKNFTYYSISEEKAHKALGVENPNPWVLGSGSSSYVFVDSQYAYERFINSGVDEKKLFISGHVEHDDLFLSCSNKDQIEKFIFKKYRLVKYDPIIIVSLPHLYEHGLSSKDYQKKLHHDILSVVCKFSKNILISLHPKMEIKVYEKLEEIYPVKVISESLKEVLPIAEFYIVGQGSNTITWGVLAGASTLVIDWFDHTLIRFRDLKEVFWLSTHLDLSIKLNELISLNRKVVSNKGEFFTNEKYLSPFDGECVKRIFNFREFM